MFAEPPGFDRAALVAALHSGWGIVVAALEYAPVGFGTHHYRARDAAGTEWFVNVDIGADPVALERAFGTAAALAAAGLEFVHAPHRRPDGRCVTVMAGGHAVSVVGVIDGISHDFDELPPGRTRSDVLTALGRLHATRPDRLVEAPDRLVEAPDRPATPGGSAEAPVDPLTVPRREELAEARAALDLPWAGGPYSARTREIVASRGGLIDALFARFDALVPAVRAGRDRWVVTHGEPHAGNVMVAATGGIRLIDWDTAAIGPPERDLWMIEPRDAAEWAAYGRATAADPDAMALYRLRWRLSEICEYVHELRCPHADDENTKIAWRELSGYLTPAI